MKKKSASIVIASRKTQQSLMRLVSTTTTIQTIAKWRRHLSFHELEYFLRAYFKSESMHLQQLGMMFAKQTINSFISDISKHLKIPTKVNPNTLTTGTRITRY